MGCDIHSFAEKQLNGQWVNLGVAPFDWRSYGMFAFLAGVRNYSAVSPIAERRGFPGDASDEVRGEYSDWAGDAHSASWLTVKELSDFDYDARMEDRRVTRRVAAGYYDGGQTCDPGEGQTMTYREFLGSDFFDDIEKLKAAGAERVVFWFDN